MTTDQAIRSNALREAVAYFASLPSPDREAILGFEAEKNDDRSMTLKVNILLLAEGFEEYVRNGMSTSAPNP